MKVTVETAPECDITSKEIIFHFPGIKVILLIHPLPLVTSPPSAIQMVTDHRGVTGGILRTSGGLRGRGRGKQNAVNALFKVLMGAVRKRAV